MDAQVAIDALREIAKEQDYEATKKRQEAAVLLREASVHSNLWACLDNEADRLQRALNFAGEPLQPNPE